jgi:hypothetical protein
MVILARSAGPSAERRILQTRARSNPLACAGARMMSGLHGADLPMERLYAIGPCVPENREYT